MRPSVVWCRWRACSGLFALLGLVTTAALPARGSDARLDRLDEALTWSDPTGQWRARLSGLLDLEGYALPQPAPGVIDAEGRYLFNPRLSVYLDAQLGPTVYVFAQARADRGFDPSHEPLEARLDEYALRWAPDPLGRFNLQVGMFATVVGNWTARHDSWSNPFITAPLPYENLTGVWDNEPPHSAGQLLVWSHLRPPTNPAELEDDKYLRLPILWGPSYTAGIAVAGALDKWRYAFEVKNASLSSRPQAWSVSDAQWQEPTVSGRIRFVPDQRWEFGWSASSGTFLRPSASKYLAPSLSRADYRQIVLGQDVTFAWHHLQVWAEIYAARFRLPRIGNADTAAYYIEVKYKLTPQASAAVRWNQQLFGRISERGRQVRWGENTWRIDVAPAYRLTPHTQVKLQYSLQRGNTDTDHATHLFATQLTVRW